MIEEKLVPLVVSYNFISPSIVEIEFDYNSFGQTDIITADRRWGPCLYILKQKENIYTCKSIDDEPIDISWVTVGLEYFLISKAVGEYAAQ